MRFNIAGAFSKSRELMLYFFKHKDIIKNFDITVYDGINNCPWNGGRINRDISFDEQTIDFYYRNNISIALTFTNPLVDLNDEIGNMLLEKFHKPGNVIISVNPTLCDYIKQNYPLYKHTRSITGFGKIHVPMKDEDFNLYKECEQRYDYIVPRCEHIFDPRFIELDQSKYEIMLNDTCVYNCPYYGLHFEEIAAQNRLYKSPWADAGHHKMYEIEECWLSDRSTYKKPKMFDPDVGGQKTIDKFGSSYGMDLKLEQIQTLYKQGIRNFKITGREMTSGDFNCELDLYLNQKLFML